jgi:hypothetical protein
MGRIFDPSSFFSNKNLHLFELTVRDGNEPDLSELRTLRLAGRSERSSTRSVMGFAHVAERID